ncbi:hemin-degrading factor [Celeribacter indicus]|uniref:Hemin-degrading protein n=1 Tax=Celeribacter indicus TaxID=1208324 RepID=A0A0B5E7V7_9RHOB|nr:hemin-degrading factor [Celeribacter indicus]AJE48382.1 hemin-degrading protein [Celeribacter indicus]SDW74460.1 putative hemin transport protein [Celeribacter indicus]
MTKPLTAADIRAAKVEHAQKRDRDLADMLGISEAELVAAHTGARDGMTVTRIAHAPDTVMPLMTALGEVMSLTRNASCVHERVGTFEEYRSGAHAAMVLGKEIDTRIFPKHWAYGFAIENGTDTGIRRTLQFFDPAGDALQKIFLREGSNHEAWAPLVDRLRLPDQSTGIAVAPREAPEGAKINADKRDILLSEWQRMTDTHQFNRLTAKLGMNRLGAYRLAGAPLVRRVAPEAVAGFLEATSAARQKVILFVGNRGNIQIHWGTLDTVKPMGPWLNVLDPRFNLHLRGDHVAEVYVVDKPTKRGPAVSIEAFDAEGSLIFQCFGQRESDDDALATWHGILADLPDLREAAE